MTPTSLLLFDIDATLLLTGGAGMRAMARAARELFGERLTWDGIDPSGGLDPLLFSEAVARSRLELAEDAHSRFHEKYVEILEVELRQSRAGIRVLPGVRELLETLRSRPDVCLGVLTGNYSRGAALKLEAAGIDPRWFSIGVFGDEGATRAALVSVALERFEAAHGGSIARERVIIIGDTPRDVEAALAHGCRVLAVATGKHGIETLLAAGATAAVADLSDPAPLLGLLEGEGFSTGFREA